MSTASVGNIDDDVRADVVVRREDQLEICEFGKLNAQKIELTEELSEIEVRPRPRACALYLARVHVRCLARERRRLRARTTLTTMYPPLQKRLSQYEDAEEAVLLSETSELGAFKLVVGECYVDTDGDAASALISSMLERDKGARDAAASKLAAIGARQEALKTKLYARFGKSISAERGPLLAPARKIPLYKTHDLPPQTCCLQT